MKNFNALDHIIREMNQLVNKNETMMNQMSENYAYYFEWNAKEIYTNTIKIAELKSIIDNTDHEGFEETLKAKIKAITLYVMSSYNVRATSTCELRNAASTWKYLALLDLLEELKRYERNY